MNPQSGPTPLPINRLALFSMAPGMAIVTLYLITARPVLRLGYPALAALLVSATVGVVVLQLPHLFVLGYRKSHHVTLDGVVGYREAIPASRFVTILLLSVCVAVAGLLCTSALDGWLVKHVFHWLPAWYNYFDPTQFAQVSRDRLLQVAAMRLGLDGIAIPVVEELYFRGYLLARTGGSALRAALVNASLFTVYHLWQPFNYPTIFIVAFILAYVVRKTRSVSLGIAIHMLLNIIGAGLGTLLMLHR